MVSARSRRGGPIWCDSRALPPGVVTLELLDLLGAPILAYGRVRERFLANFARCATLWIPVMVGRVPCIMRCEMKAADAETGPTDQRRVRRHNLQLVLQQVAEHGPRSRATLASQTGLNKTTVSSLVAELIQQGLLRETGTERPGAVGRPAQKIELAADRIVALGLEINVNYLAICVADLSGHVIHSSFVMQDNRRQSPHGVVRTLASLVEEALVLLEGQHRQIVGATVALPGLVDIARGMLFLAPNLEWEQIPVADLLDEELGHPLFPVRVDNEANLGALAELSYGVGRHARDFVYVSAGVGVGAGIVIGGELFRGAQGFGGEFGHMIIDRSGPRCNCGSRGCLEALIGEESLIRLAGISSNKIYLGADPEEAIELIAGRARAGEKQPLDALVQMGQSLAMGASLLVNLCDPKALVLGGHYAPLSEWLLPEVEREIMETVLSARWSMVRTYASKLGGAAAARGAATLALRDTLSDPRAVALPSAT